MTTNGVQTSARDLLSERVIGAAIEVHKHVGPGLLESAYEECLAWELTRLGVPVERQVPLPLNYKGLALDVAYRIDMIVDGRLLLELKAVEKFEKIHEAQILTYLKLSGIHTGLLINFNVPALRVGIKRFVV